MSLVVMILLLAGCQSAQSPQTITTANKYKLITPGLIELSSLQFNNPDDWSQVKRGSVISWTQDGVLLNEVVFNQINTGQNILGQTGNIPVSFQFDHEMSLNLVLEQFTDALITSDHYHNVKLLGLQPLMLSGHQAIKFKISYDTSSNVNYSAWVLFIKKQDKLLTVFCSGTTRYYFPKLEQTYLQILDSVQII